MPRKITSADKLAALDRLIGDMRAGRVVNLAAGLLPIDELRAIHGDLQAESPKAIGRVLEAMRFQVESARRGKSRLGFFDHGAMQTITEGLCGRWWPVIERALKRGEQERAET